jgi:acetyl esterase/lipase
MKKTLSLACALTLSSFCAVAHSQELPLYGDKIPNSKPSNITERIDTNAQKLSFIYGVTQPTLTAYLPDAEKANGSAVVVCPGGGYGMLAITHEGVDIAKRLSGIGVAAFVLKYRMPKDESMINKEIGPLQDAQRALQLVRQNAEKWNVNPGKVGIMGFSAGGHLAASAATHFTKPKIDSSTTSLRPDFAILIYPVISFQDGITHVGSRDALLGQKTSKQDIDEYSNELQVTQQTPPAFLVHAQDDEAVPVQNSLSFYTALTKNSVPAEMHLYQKGGHGFGLNNSTTKDEWFDRLANWMALNGWCRMTDLRKE